jgi:hypothetical protein
VRARVQYQQQSNVSFCMGIERQFFFKAYRILYLDRNNLLLVSLLSEDDVISNRVTLEVEQPVFRKHSNKWQRREL